MGAMGDLAGGGIGRRDLLKSSAALVAGLALPSAMPASAWAAPRKRPDSLPFPKAPPGEDMIPQIDHIVVAMMENHTYDNYLGLLERGDGFTLDRSGRPKNACPDGNSNLIRAFHMPSTCQLDRVPSQAWDASHQSLGKGRGTTGSCSRAARAPWATGTRTTCPSPAAWPGRSRSAIASSRRASPRPTQTASSSCAAPPSGR